MSSIYKTGEYLAMTNRSWHSEDSPWKAEQILGIMQKNSIHPRRLAEIGCGAGQILVELSSNKYLQETEFVGYDISPQAIELCKQTNAGNCRFFCQDIFERDNNCDEEFDVLLAIDVFEHVPDYMGFLEKCRQKAKFKIYHIPLDVHVSAVLRDSLVRSRYSVGHLHYFDASSALATLRDTGHQIVDYSYTSGAIQLYKYHPKVKTAIANIPRWIFSRISLPFTARVFGGYSLLVLAK